MVVTNEILLIMDGDNEDVNLALALGSANYRVQTKPSNSSGAGVNANFMVGMTFAASDTLSELVWSPHNGLSLKPADSSLADKKSFIRWNVGPSNNVLPPYQSVRSMRTGDEVATDDVMLTLAQPMLDADSKLGDKSIEDSCEEKRQIKEGAGTPRVTCYSQNVNEPNAKSGNMELGIATCSAPNGTKFCEDANARSLMEPDDTRTSASGGMNRSKGEMLYFNNAPSMKELEASDENELCNLTEKEVRSLGETRLLPRESSLPVERFPTNNKICLYQEKGKAKALSDGGMYRRPSNDDDDSNESVESCSSVGLFSKGIKRQNYDEDLIIGSKRMKKQAQGSHGSSSMVKPHSSFMNWISNMVRGLSDSYKEESSALGLTLSSSNDEHGKDDREIFACNKTHGSPSLNMGFQTMFQSLYCRDNRIPDAEAQEENDSPQESKEITEIGKASPNNLPESCHGNNENSCKEIVVSNKQVNTHIDQHEKPWEFYSDLACTPYAYKTNLAENKGTEIPAYDNTVENTGPNFSLATCDVPGKSNYHTSLWITRLSTGIPRLENFNQISQPVIGCSIEYPKVILESRMNDVVSMDHKRLESKSYSHNDRFYASAKEKPKIPSPEFGSSEAVASVFARRLDALKHIVASEKISSCSSTCYFCGKSGHDLRECPEVTETELDNLPIKISSYERVEVSQCLCIRCFQFDHWAISCPSVSSYRHWQSKQNLSAINHLTAQTSKVNESSGKGISNSNQVQKSFKSHAKNETKYGQNKNLRLFSVVAAHNIDVPIEICHAIRKLRLSRVDILRWMNAHVSSVHLSGFFLRLRLGKLETVQGATNYYVACITGDTPETIICRSKKSILVDVGGIKSSVGSQYISNHDFLEDEIKAWWCRILGTGSKIPSLDELNAKFNDRKSLGF